MRLADIAQHVLECRDISHQWNHEWTLFADNGEDVERLCVCLRCGTVRIEVIDRHIGITIRRRYRYTEDFAVPGMEKSLTRRDYRVEFIRRQLAAEATAQKKALANPKPRARARKKEVSNA